MSDGIQLFIILFVVFFMFSIINFLAISLSQHSFKRRVVAGVIFLLLTPIIFLTTTTLTSIFDNADFGIIDLTSSIINLYILNGIVILLSASFILKKQNIR
ncbi:hypothetical protein AB1I92_10810 [Bacillus mobilis]|uniref:Uncharacterized protein n=2 Tax=Bacillus cereus group TaxID=86661 RepID=A0A1C4CYU0_BACCE|nr:MULTISPECIES: hypothetical protein [Bacillus cereus group]MCU5434853.1 hypothetical protein [Bacillus mobilis]MCU5594288.1 hypothetical protein [Bacillus mobilis]MCU5736354.1 hypothetical protein [Bacillus mobilis]MCU9561964.1 hypothetical protein [Bacillus mobilis]OKA37879.1 hypothetical protein BJR06_10520 [Bacillus cereus]